MTGPVRELRDLRSFLEEVVSRSPGDIVLVDDEGSLTFAELDACANRAANLFLGMGLEKGDRVALLLPNCREFLFLWFGLAKAGIVHVPLNTRLRGEPLRHQLTDCAPAAAVVGAEQLASYEEVAAGTLLDHRVLVESAGRDTEGRYADLGAALRASSAQAPPPAALYPGDPLVIMYTSGTTGAAKGVVNCHNAYVRAATDLQRLMGLKRSDRMYVFLPLFHGNPQMMGVMPILAAGGSIALSPRFSASRFWDEVRGFCATVFTHIGSPLAILMKREERPDDGDNPIRLILGGAPAEISAAFGRRFRCSVLDGWGMIEAGCNTSITPVDRNIPGTNGFARECFDVRIFNEQDRECAPGEAGEIVVRPLEPFVMFSGYFRAPSKTLATYRNLWFHTGDLGRKCEDKTLLFLGRSQDAIRRKGENIASNEVENVLLSHPDIDEVAVVGVADDIAGQEIKACLKLRPRAAVTPEAVVEWCTRRLPDFMVPRYIAFKMEFEKTGSEKIKRYPLRDEGVAGAWDREARQVARATSR